MARHPFARLGLLATAGAAAAALLAGCDGGRDSPLAPEAAPSALLAPQPAAPLELAAALTRTRPLAVDLTVTATIDRRGGSFAIPGAGLKVVVPRGAVETATVFTATALKGDMVAYDFGPHGATFRVPLEVTQALKGTSWDRVKNPAAIEAGYFRSDAQLVDALDLALVDEFLPVSVDAAKDKLKFGVRHFSGYMVSSGRLQAR